MEAVSSITSEPADRRSGVRIAILLLIPVSVATWFSPQNSPAPVVMPAADRPALVFSQYMATSGSEPVRDEPVISAEFAFRNISDREARLTELVPSCGCLAPSFHPQVVPPGGVGVVRLPVRTANEAPGPHEYLVTVRYEDSQPRELNLTWKVVLPEKQLLVEPNVLIVMGQLSDQQSYPIRLLDGRPERRGQPIRIQRVEVSSALFTCEPGETQVTDDRIQTDLLAKFRPPIPPGRHRGLIIVKTDDAAFPVLHVPVLVSGPERRAGDDPRASPEAPIVIVGSDSEPETAAVEVELDVPARWTVSHYDVFPSGLSVQPVSSETSAERSLLKVRIAVDSPPAGGIERGVLTLNATDGDQTELLTVPLTLVRGSRPEQRSP
jgi:hypothetical protein